MPKTFFFPLIFFMFLMQKTESMYNFTLKVDNNNLKLMKRRKYLKFSIFLLSQDHHHHHRRRLKNIFWDNLRWYSRIQECWMNNANLFCYVYMTSNIFHLRTQVNIYTDFSTINWIYQMEENLNKSFFVQQLNDFIIMWKVEPSKALSLFIQTTSVKMKFFTKIFYLLYKTRVLNVN